MSRMFTSIITLYVLKDVNGVGNSLQKDFACRNMAGLDIKKVYKEGQDGTMLGACIRWDIVIKLYLDHIS